ncbi:MAG: hypothetical protein KBS95_01625 [Alistipes sp.]|nr:hypothetical protein [Candidatus Alistipes equi]
MEKKFNVAGHIFSLKMRDESPMWQRLDNYTPFITEEGEPIFSLKVVKELSSKNKNQLLISGDAVPEMPRIDLYQEEDGGKWIEIAPLATMEPCGFIRISKDYTQGEIQIKNNPKFCIDNSLMIMYAFRTVTLRTLEMHSSVTVHEGKAYMFLGHSGAGKSTHSRMWLENIPDSFLLNDDNPILRILDNKEVRVYGSPWSGKTPCYKNLSAPVQATISIVQAPHNSIRRFSTMEAFSALHSSISGYWGDEEMVDNLCSTISDFISSIKHFELKCLADADAARLSLKTANK